MGASLTGPVGAPRPPYIFRASKPNIVSQKLRLKKIQRETLKVYATDI